MKPTAELPHDPALRGLAAIRAAGLAGAIPALGLGDRPVEVHLCGYTPGSRATLEVRAEGLHFAVKAYAEDPTPEAALYQAFAAGALAGAVTVRVPHLLVWERDLRLLAISWLDGTPANRLVKSGQGQRAGELAATLLWRLTSVAVRLGPPFGPGDLLYQVGRSVAELGVVDRAIATTAKQVAMMLKRTQPKNGHAGLVHGTLYARHILDLGDGPGVIDWQQFGQGPVELDAGMFLATISRLGLRHEPFAGEAARTEEAFLAGIRGLLDERALAWYRAAALLHLAGRGLKRSPPAEARALVGEAARFAESARRDVPALRLRDSALEFILQALSTRPATPAEVDQLRKLLDDVKAKRSSSSEQ